jgi:hypothetical protein
MELTEIMGTWGPNSFENDDALDLVNFLVSGHDLQWIEDTFRAVLTNEDDIWDDDAQSGIAASEVVALMRGNPADSLPESLIQWQKQHAFSADDQLIRRAIQVTEKILAKSGLRDLWEEGGESFATPWKASVEDLLARLRS